MLYIYKEPDILALIYKAALNNIIDKTMFGSLRYIAIYKKT